MAQKICQTVAVAYRRLFRNWYDDLMKKGGGDFSAAVGQLQLAAAIGERSKNIQRTLGGYRAPRQPGDRGKKRSTLAHRAAQDARSTNAMRAR